MRNGKRVVAIVLAGIGVACSSPSGSGPDGGSGGTTGTAGASAGTAGGSAGTGGATGGAGHGGSSAAGTTGTAGASGGCWPACVEAAQAGCWRPATGTCTYAVIQGGGRKICYSNGITEAVDSLNKMHDFSNASGRCFSFDNTSPPASTTSTYAFLDGAGNQVATATSTNNGLTLTITCGGQDYTVDTTAAACATVNPNSCTASSTATCP